MKLLNLTKAVSISIFISSFLLTSCDIIGSGGGEEESKLSTYQVFKTESGKIYIVDTDDQSNERLVEGIDPNSVQVILTGDYTSSKLKDIRNYAVVYSKDGKIYKAIIDKENENVLKIEQISNEDEATNICESKAYPDFLNPEVSVYLYKLPDGNDCDSDDAEWKMVKLNTPNDEKPIRFHEYKPVIPLYERSKGDIVGWVKKKHSKMKYCDEDLDNCETIDVEIGDIDNYDNVQYIGGLAYEELGKTENDIFNKDFFKIDDEIYMFIYNINDTDEAYLLRLYEFKFLPDLPAGNFTSHVEKNTLYFNDGGRILKFKMTEIEGDDKEFTGIVDEGKVNIKDFILTDERVVYIVEDIDGNDYMFSVKKDGTDKMLLLPPDPLRGRELSLVSSAPDKNYVYYNVNETKKNRKIAGVIEDDDNDLSTIDEKEYSYWTGGVYPTNIELFSRPAFSKIIRIDRCPPNESCATDGGIRAIDTNDADNGIAIGIIPDDIKKHEDMFGFGKRQIGTGYTQNGKGDIFYMDLDEKFSMIRITNTPNLSEQSVKSTEIPFYK